jgi:hypothetical protein
MARPQRPEACDLYLPGHCVHWIQARKASTEAHSWGRLVNVVDDGIITVEFLDGVGRYRNHRVETLLDIAAPGTKVAVCERYRTLRVDIDYRTSTCFCITGIDDPWTPCSCEPLISVTLQSLAERLNLRGGVHRPRR